jgi:3'(2'), 5'-bisphosphate nucleotidase
VPWEVRRHWREYWLVDPLDGTKEFIQRNGQFTVNIALVRAGGRCWAWCTCPCPA